MLTAFEATKGDKLKTYGTWDLNFLPPLPQHMTLATLQHTSLNPLSLSQTYQSQTRCHYPKRRRLTTVIIVPNTSDRQIHQTDQLHQLDQELQTDQLLQINQLLQPIRPNNHQTKWPLNLLSSVAQTSASSLLPFIPRPSPSLPSTSSSTKPAVHPNSTTPISPSHPETTTGASYSLSTRASSMTTLQPAATTGTRHSGSQTTHQHPAASSKSHSEYRSAHKRQV